MDKVEMKTHFALWSVMGSPLILGEDENQNPVLYTVQRTDHAVLCGCDGGGCGGSGGGVVCVHYIYYRVVLYNHS